MAAKKTGYYLKALSQLTLMIFLLTVFLLLAIKLIVLPTVSYLFPEKIENDAVVEKILPEELNASVTSSEKEALLNATAKHSPKQGLAEAAEKIAVKEQAAASPTETKQPTPKKPAAPAVIKTKAPAQPAEYSKEDQRAVNGLKRIITSFGVPNLNVEDLADIIYLESLRYKIDPLITTAIIYTESTFNRYASSKNDKHGLMQIYPDDAKQITQKLGLPYLNDITLYHPLYNVRIGLDQLSKLEKESGSLDAGIKAYARRQTADKKLVSELTAENYLQKVKTLEKRFRTKAQKKS